MHHRTTTTAIAKNAVAVVAAAAAVDPVARDGFVVTALFVGGRVADVADVDDGAAVAVVVVDAVVFAVVDAVGVDVRTYRLEDPLQGF